MKKKNANGAGTAPRQREDGRWEARYTEGFDPKTGKQIQKSIYGHSEKEVLTKLRAIQCDLDKGTYIKPNQIKLGEWLDMWLRDCTGNLKPETKAAYEQHVRVHIKPKLGKVKLQELSALQIQQLYNALQNESGLSPKTIHNIHGVLHRALEQAVRYEYLAKNPSRNVIRPRMEKKPLQTLDDAGVVKLLQAIRDDPYELEIFVALFTGLREGELLGLSWDRIDFANGTILVDRQHNRPKGEKEFRFYELKNSKTRRIVVPEPVLDALRTQKKRQEGWAKALGEAWSNPENLVFTTEFGRYINNKTLTMNFKRIAHAIGLGNLRFHDLRHTFAANSLHAGVSIKEVQDNLGHATASFTLATYAYATVQMKKESAERMGRFITEIQTRAQAINS